MGPKSRSTPISASSLASSASPSGKRARDPEDEVYLDNVCSQKRYLSEVWLSLSLSLFDSIVQSDSFRFNCLPCIVANCIDCNWLLLRLNVALVDNGLQFKRTNRRRLASCQHVRLSFSLWHPSFSQQSHSQVCYIIFFFLASSNSYRKAFWYYIWLYNIILYNLNDLLMCVFKMQVSTSPDFKFYDCLDIIIIISGEELHSFMCCM